MRAHIVLAEDTIKDVDRFAGKRRRSRFVEVAVREKLARERLSRALAETAGVLSLSKYPEWETPETASRWVAARRGEDNKSLLSKLRKYRS